jgi:sarcosine oxidase gamma subunit
MQTDHNITAALAYLKSGFRIYVTNVKLPLSADTKWILETVCIHDLKPENLNTENSSKTIYSKAQVYIHNHLYNLQENINQNRESWLQ